MLKKLNALINCHFEYIMYRFAFVMDLKSFSVIAFSLANFAGSVNIGKKVHFDFDYSVAFTSLTASTLYVE